MPPHLKLFKPCLFLIIVFLILFATTLFSLPYLPYEYLKAKISTFDNVDKNADAFNFSLYKQIIFNSRIVAILFFLISGVLYATRRQLEQYASAILVSLFTFTRELLQHFHKVVKQEDRIHLYCLFVILLLAITVRLCFLFQPIRYDEASTYLTYASKPLFIALSYYPAPNNHLFHTLLVHIAYLLLGSQPWVLRLPALFAGILLIPASYIVARIFYNKRAALLTAGFTASSSALIGFSTNARGYTMICLIFLLLLAFGTYLVQSRNSFVWLLFSILSALGFYTIPIMLYPFGLVFVWLFLSIMYQNTNPHRSFLLKNLFISLIITACLTSILYSPVFAITGLKSVFGRLPVTGRGTEFFLQAFPLSVQSVWNAWNRDVPTVLKFLLVAGFFTSLIFHKRLTIYRVPISLAAVIWIIPLLLVQRVVPFDRVWLFLLPLYIILACAGVSYLLGLIELKINGDKSILSMILSITLSFWVSWNVVNTQSVYYSPDGALTDAEAITIFLKDYLKPGDKVLAIIPSYYPLQYYFYLHRLPSRYLVQERDLRSEWNSAQRRFVIVNKSNGQIVNGNLDEKGSEETGEGDLIDMQRFRAAGKKLKRILEEESSGVNVGDLREIQRYRSATLYEVSRVQRE